jgi:hypothetical protein
VESAFQNWLRLRWQCYTSSTTLCPWGRDTRLRVYLKRIVLRLWKRSPQPTKGYFLRLFTPALVTAQYQFRVGVNTSFDAGR